MVPLVLTHRQVLPGGCLPCPKPETGEPGEPATAWSGVKLIHAEVVKVVEVVLVVAFGPVT